MTCTICNQELIQSNINKHLHNGFQCKDTGLFIHWKCRKEFYRNKNTGVYGTQHIHKYTEFPVPFNINNSKSNKYESNTHINHKNCNH